jgi:hypothetical protein
MNKRELDFRRDLLDQMAGLWYPTIHVENHLSPGVPDLSFVLIAKGFETGWVELKSVIKPADVFVEASQHRWFERHCQYVPTCFLIDVNGTVFVVPGARHSQLMSVTNDKLIDNSTHRFLRDGLAHKLRPILMSMTRVSNRVFTT